MPVFQGTVDQIESTKNKVAQISSTSTDEQYPSAKAVYKLQENINDLQMQVGPMYGDMSDWIGSDTVYQAVTKLKAKDTDLQSQIDALSGVDVSELQSQIDTANTDISALKTTDEDLQAQINTLSGVDMSEFQSQLDNKSDATNLVNGSAEGSLRSIGAKEEGSGYTIGECAVAIGGSTTASGDYSHAEGLSTTASGGCSHAEGRITTASGDYSHAEGHDTTASGGCSHAEGLSTTASGEASHAEGLGTIAGSHCQHAQGKCNIADNDDKYLHIVGNGSGYETRSNAHTLDWNGNAWFAGDVIVGGTSQDDENAIKLTDISNTTADLQSQITAEIANRQSADENLQSQIDTLESDIVDLQAQTLQQTPLFADSIEECTDTSSLYVLPDGYMYAYMRSTKSQEIKVLIDGETDNTRVSSGGTAGQNGYVTTPLIDLRAYPVPFTLHLDGVPYIPSVVENYSRYATFDTSQTFVVSQKTSTGTITNDVGGTPTVYTDGKSEIVFNSIKDNLQYVRFSGLGTSADSNIYVTYTEEVTGEQWTNTGIMFVGGSIDEETLAKISELNNEGASPSTIKLLPKPVLDFYNASAYSDSNYTTSHLSNITYPCRADIPVPYSVKWKYNENAMRTTLAVDTKPIGTSNKYTLLTYDVTGLNKYPLYNLIPNTRYFYKITHILSDGSLMEAKNGNFLTASESIRLLYIDGTQNVRDLGGWSGLNGKKVKYGKIFRGASLSDSSFPELIVTGKGRRSLGELDIQAELNLGATDTETSIASNCAYAKIDYASYATAITDATRRERFKTALEWVVEQLTASKPVYFHCQGGCDRTGTFAFQLLGLLGVSESDLAKDYELSSFSSIGYGRLRTTTLEANTYDYVGLINAIKTYNGSAITDKFYNFAKTCGVSAETIASFRSLMLE